MARRRHVRTASAVGVRGRDGDASRLLASASIAIQQVVGIDIEPALADAVPDGVLVAASAAGVVVVGLSPRWRREGLGTSRHALLAAVSSTLVVHRGKRPGRPRAARAVDALHLEHRRRRLISDAGREP